MGEIISSAIQYGTEKCKDFVNIDDIFQNLQQQAEHLFSKGKDIREVITSQLDMRVTHECQNWLDCVEKANGKFEEIKIKYLRLQENGWNLAVLNKVKLSEEMKKLIGEIVDILKDGMKPETVSTVDNRVAMVEKKFAEELQDINTFHEVVEKLLCYLNDESIKSIGVWGMANIGKSAIMANLNDKLGDRRMFDIVIWVTVSKGGSVRKIQNAIADRLKLKVDSNKNDYNLAKILGKALENKKYLVLLDDVCEKIDLRDVGILHNHDLGKVVLATRYRLVCQLMETDEDIEVKRMNRKEAWKMFRKIVGEVVERPNIGPIAERVLYECGELPQLIKIVGRKLKNTIDEETWLRILSMLQSPSNSRLQPMEEVFNAFKLVYDELDDNLKHCLLYGASFPDDQKISKDRLIECWKAEDLILNAQMISKARREGKILMETLIEKYLLDRCKEIDYVKMSLLFRKMALRMAGSNTSWLMLVRHDDPIEKWGFARVISLTNDKLPCLPEKPECPKLSTLFLQKNQMLTIIPPSFFEFMSCLKVLDLCGSGISSLPNSISNLFILRNLYLNQCEELTVLPRQVAELNHLEVLEICETGLYGLPSDIGKLTKLQCLKVSFKSCPNHISSEMDMIPSGMLKNLSLLQELTIDIDESFQARWNQLAPRIAEEVATLENLNSLTFNFPNLNIFEVFLNTSISWKNSHTFTVTYDSLRTFSLTIGARVRNHLPQLDLSECSAKRYFKYFDGQDISNAIKDVLKRVCAFEMVGHKTAESLSDFGVDMECLEICVIQECDKIRKIVSSDTPRFVFPWLRELHLLKLEQFEYICEGSILPKSFALLNTLILYDCASLKKLMSVEMTKHNKELQYLRIEKCSQLTEIIALELLPHPMVHPSSTLPKLKKLELIDLPNLVSIYDGDVIDCPSLQRVEIIECKKLGKLPFSRTNVKQLKSIHCNESWWNALHLSLRVKAELQKICCFT